MTWWEDDDFLIEFCCEHTLELWARYRCTVKENTDHSADEYDDGGYDPEDESPEGWDY